jgi:threonine dehydrogenase-like Zn-dependent dehydrogenase
VKALVLRSPRVFDLAEVPIPELTGQDEVLVQVDCCGICGSDLRYWAGDNPWAAHTLGRTVRNPPNIVLGHEFVGRVVRVRSPRHEHLMGRRVAVQPFRVCGQCHECRRGLENLCGKTIHLGHAQGWPPMELYPGAYAEYCVAWGDLVFPVPDHLSSEAAAMMDILCVAVHAASRVRDLTGARVLCIGGGPAGAAIGQVARSRAAAEVIISEPSPVARRVLDALGFPRIMDPLAGDAAEMLGGPVDVIFDTVGSGRTVEKSLELLASAGVYVAVAVHDAAFRGNLQHLGTERVWTSSSNATYADVREAFRLICSAEVSTEPMISHRFPLAQYQIAYNLLLAEPKQAYKVVLTPSARQGGETLGSVKETETAA